MTRISTRAGFTLIELMAVVVILAILAGVALPKFFDYQTQARVAATKGTLGGVRAGIASFYADSAIAGTPLYPTMVELNTLGTVMQENIPENPYDSSNTLTTATAAEVAGPRTIGAAESGWKYFVDNVGAAKSAVFYANSDSAGENDF